jgi:tetratricopeptide (TPR) repeat protein
MLVMLRSDSAQQQEGMAAMTPQDAPKVVRRLAAAEGFLELGMAPYALGELSRIPDAGPFEGIAKLLAGEALQAEHRFDEAISALNRAAELFPQPFNQRAWWGLSQCYRQQGQLDLAEQAEANATPPDLPPGTKLQVAFISIFQVEDKPQPRHKRPPKKG